MMKKVFLLIFILFLFPLSVDGATPTKTTVAPKKVEFEISGWIPYWRSATGTDEAIAHIDVLKEINPFGYGVKDDGTLLDLMKIDQEPWSKLFALAREKKVRIIPTVTWANTQSIDRILKSKKLRTDHINAIVKMVKDNNFDGVDIDYEAKKAATRPYFSAFLRELYAAMGKKFVMCTIEARTPLTSRFDNIPKNIEYANDYVAINNYCDRVRIMTYDQGAIDIRLNQENLGPYVPVSDPRWVEKVINLTAKSIPKKKIVIGIPTYGYEYRATKLKDDGYKYEMLWAFNPKYALELAGQLGIRPVRNSAGELSFMYIPSKVAVPSTLSPDVSLLTQHIIATTTFSDLSQSTPVGTPFHILWWSDPTAIMGKVLLAKRLGVRGVAVFKIDGGTGPALWEALKAE